MKFVELTQGMVAKVDDEDFDRVNQFKWSASSSGRSFYAVRTSRDSGRKSTIYMHNFILGKKLLDHKDFDGLNNQKENLRLANKVENGRNRKVQLHSSAYKGVSFVPRQNQWQASGCLDKKKVHIGTYHLPELAALAYDTFAMAFYGQFSKTNKQMGVL